MSSCCEFPQIAAAPVPFREHPWKLFAINPATFLVWRGIGVALQTELSETDSKVMGLFVFNVAMYALHLKLNRTIMDMTKKAELFSSEDHLMWAVRATYAIHFFNLVEALLARETDEAIGDEALTVRVCAVAICVLLSAALIPFANRDRPFADQRVRNSGLLENQFNAADGV